MTRRAWLSGLVLAAILWLLVAAGFIAGRATAIAPHPWTPLPSSAFTPVATPRTSALATPAAPATFPIGAPIWSRASRTREPMSGAPHGTTRKLDAREQPGSQSESFGAPPLVSVGIASNMGPAWPPDYLALPEGRGWRVRLCGASGCATMTSTDAGPDRAMQRLGRVADLSVETFSAICGVPWTRGLCEVTVQVEGRS